MRLGLSKCSSRAPVEGGSAALATLIARMSSDAKRPTCFFIVLSPCAPNCTSIQQVVGYVPQTLSSEKSFYDAQTQARTQFGRWTRRSLKYSELPQHRWARLVIGVTTGGI